MIENLNTFICVAQNGSFRKAGELLYLSSNAVKKRIGQLEASLGFPLFERNAKGVSLTGAGHCFLRDAKLILQSYDEAAARAGQIARGGNNVLKIGLTDTYADQFLMADWFGVRRALKDLKYQLTFFGGIDSGLSSMLESVGRDIDMAVDVYDRQLAERFRLSSIKISDLSVVCGLSPEYAVHIPQSLSIRDLEGKNIVLLQKGHSPAWDRVRACIRQSCPTAVIRDVPAYSVRMFGEYDGKNHIFLMTEDWAGLYPFLHFLPLAEDFHIPFGIYCAKHPTAQIERYIHIVLHCGSS